MGFPPPVFGFSDERQLHYVPGSGILCGAIGRTAKGV